MPFQIVRQDITKMNVDAIVNAANAQLLPGGGVCGAIFRGAADPCLEKELSQLAPCETGKAVITAAYHLPAKVIIHAVGPVWKGGTSNERKLLYSAYHESLVLAGEHACESIAFPLISAGIYGYPVRQAMQVAREAIQDYLEENEMTVYLTVLGRKAVSVSMELFEEVKQYVDYYFEEDRNRRFLCEAAQEMPENIEFCAERSEAPYCTKANAAPAKPLLKKSAVHSARRLDQLLAQMGENFHQMLFRLIDEKGFSDVEVYKKANIDRKLFSKIRNHEDYQPKKMTVVAFAFALQLSLDEAMDLLEAAGYTLSLGQKSDVIVRYFLEHEIYNIYEANEILFSFDQPLIGT